MAYVGLMGKCVGPISATDGSAVYPYLLQALSTDHWHPNMMLVDAVDLSSSSVFEGGLYSRFKVAAVDWTVGGSDGSLVTIRVAQCDPATFGASDDFVSIELIGSLLTYTVCLWGVAWVVRVIRGVMF